MDDQFIVGVCETLMAVRFGSDENKYIDSRHNSGYCISRRSAVMGTRSYSKTTAIS